MPAIAGVLETVLYAADLDAAQRFYGDVLGLPLDSRKAGLFCFFRVGAGHAAAVRPGGRAPQPRRPAARRHRRRAMPASPWPRASSTAGRPGCEARRCAIEHEQTWPRGGRSFYVRDPAGNSIEFATPRIWGLPEPAAAEAAHDRRLARTRSQACGGARRRAERTPGRRAGR